ncbi:MAG TPA: cytochrome c [Terriglobia bacterium]|nr:cytochrome c [Terriglobia bacterium]
MRVSFAALLVIALAIPAVAQQPVDKKIWDGVFTSEQAGRGKSAFEGSCARCHNVALIGSERGPAIKGQTFLSHWEKGNLADIFIKIRDTMPEGGPGTVSDETKIDILSYILQQNGFPAGGEELKSNLSSLEDVRLAKKGIWDGVFTTAQAESGKATLLQNGCNGCHGAELDGDRGPALKGEKFLAGWENGSINRLFTKIRETMPPLNAEQLTPAAKLDIVAYLLQVNGFPAGATALNMDELESIQIVKRDADAAGLANFSLVEVIGCLTEGQNKRWRLTSATPPVATKDETSTTAALKAAEPQPLGSETFTLVSVSPSLRPESHKGHKVDVRGLLYRDTGYAELNLTSLDTVSSSCAN